MRIQLVFNPHSGRGRGRKMYPRIIGALRNAGHEVIPHQTLYRWHAQDIVRNLNLYETDALVVAGGDGTGYEALNGLMNNPAKKLPPLGIIPVGTGNSFPKDLNIYTMEDGINAVLGGLSRPVDVLSFLNEGEEYYFINNMGFGFVADVSIASEPIKKLGITAYAMGVIWQTARLKASDVLLNIDGEEYRHRANFVYFCNSVWVAGNMKISPDSIFDDGLVEVMVLDEVSRGELLKVFPRVFSGSHITHPSVTVYRGKHITVESDPVKYCNPDGEIFGVTPLEVKVIPDTVHYFHLEKKD